MLQTKLAKQPIKEQQQQQQQYPSIVKISKNNNGILKIIEQPEEHHGNKNSPILLLNRQEIAKLLLLISNFYTTNQITYMQRSCIKYQVCLRTPRLRNLLYLLDENKNQNIQNILNLLISYCTVKV
jgi:hypothetical protein